jgi:hypothetical protein
VSPLNPLYVSPWARLRLGGAGGAAVLPGSETAAEGAVTRPPRPTKRARERSFVIARAGAASCPHGGVGLGVDVKAIQAPLSIFCIDNRECNILSGS